ncbi:MAG: HAMP domain-containing histidine kinase [Agarilytica sp.]
MNVKAYMDTVGIEVVIPIFHKNSISSIIYVGKPAFSHFFISTDIEIFEWIQNILPKTIERIEGLNKIKNELNESRKTLSMLEVMNQYHHDIKTPLAVIDGIVSTDTYEKSTQRQIVLEQVTKGTKLIATMAGILKGKRNREIKRLSVGENIKQCLFLFDTQFEKIATHFNDRTFILGDDIDLKILFSNLLKNASEAADPKRALTLNVKTWEDQQNIYISITDSGIGMDAEKTNNLWHLEKSEKETGNAIGLQAVKRIAEEHDARITVNSTPGIGTCFELKFPKSFS